MAREVAYAIITPYTIAKSRTGAVVSRLLGRTSAKLIGTQMVALNREMADRYAAAIPASEDVDQERYRILIREYIRENLGPRKDGRKQRALMLVFHGEGAQQELTEITGRLSISSASGETIRDAYGDLVWNVDGSVRYFEPAVLVSDAAMPFEEKLNIWHNYFKTAPPLLENVCVYENPERIQQTLVLIKPDSWRQRSAKPGTIIDMFSRTGLRIIGCNLVRMSVNQAMEFYGPVKEGLCRKLSPAVGAQVKEMVERELNISLPAETADKLAETVGIPFACSQFEKIVEFMSGRKPSQCPKNERATEGPARCLALVYEGQDAVAKIRAVLGPTDPTKAPDGTVRKEFGSDVMVNTAHASDSPENAQREIGILQLRKSSLLAALERTLEE